MGVVVTVAEHARRIDDDPDAPPECTRCGRQLCYADNDWSHHLDRWYDECEACRLDSRGDMLAGGWS